ncbi:MAG: hypothetical protein ABH840_02580 [Nanoarchaeota archaeon]
MKKQIILVITFAFVFLFSLSFVLGVADHCGYCEPGTTPEKISVAFCRGVWAWSGEYTNGGWPDGSPYSFTSDSLFKVNSINKLGRVNLVQSESDSCMWTAEIDDAIGMGYENVNGKPNEKNADIWETDMRGNIVPPWSWSEIVDARVTLNMEPAYSSYDGATFYGWTLYGDVINQQSVLSMNFFTSLVEYGYGYNFFDGELAKCDELPLISNWNVIGGEFLWGFGYKNCI